MPTNSQARLPADGAFFLHNFPYAECSAMFCIPFTFLEMTFEL